MSKISVSLDPSPTWRKEVTIHGPGGQALVLDLEFRHRDEDELKAFSTGDSVASRSDVESVMGAVVNWHNVDREFNAESVAYLVKKWQSAARTILTTYVFEQSQARLGN